MAERTRIGDLLVAAGLITEEQVRRTLVSQKQSGRRFGEELVALGFVNEVQVTQMLSNQLSVPWVSLYHVEFTRDLLNLLPAEVAQRFCIVPVYVRKVRHEGETLYVAMDDPTNEEAIHYVREATNMPVRTMVAPPSEIRDAIGVYYFGLPPRSTRVVRVEDEEAKTQRRPALIDLHNEAKRTGVSPPPPRETVSPFLPSAEAIPAAPEDVPEEPLAFEPAAGASVHASTATAPATPETPGPVPEAPSVDTASAAPVEPASSPKAQRPKAEGKRRSTSPKMLTLTLLDGTTVRLPQPPEKEPESEAPPHEHGLTAADLVQALKARAQGQDTSAVLPDGQWEPLFAALLSLLVRKGVVADWEFVDEWKKLTR